MPLINWRYKETRLTLIYFRVLSDYQKHSTNLYRSFVFYIIWVKNISTREKLGIGKNIKFDNSKSYIWCSLFYLLVFFSYWNFFLKILCLFNTCSICIVSIRFLNPPAISKKSWDGIFQNYIKNYFKNYSQYANFILFFNHIWIGRYVILLHYDIVPTI